MEKIYTRHKIYNKFPCIEDEILHLLYIPLMNKDNNVVKYAVVSLECKAKLLQFRYHLATSKHLCRKEYAISCVGKSMHEIVIGKKVENGYMIDHINGYGIDNREENLQIATDGLNAQNKPKRDNCSSQYIGVSFCNKKNWRSEITKDGNHIRLGSFENEIDAAKMYDVHAIDHYKRGQPRTNNLLTTAEIYDIKQNGIPEKYQIKTISKLQSLPKNICLEGNIYRVKIERDGKRMTGSAKSLEEAIILKENMLKKYEEDEKIKNITKNSRGICIIMAGGVECFVDEKVWPDVSKYNWHVRKNTDGKLLYPYGRVNNKSVFLHKYIYEKYIGPVPDNMTIDHIKSNQLFDVRLQNLRLGDASLQNHNRILVRKGIDTYTGVQFRRGKFAVGIAGNHYGSYETAEEAAEKANEIYKLKYGENATLNDIDYTKTTTKHNRISDDILTREFVIQLSTIIDLRNIIMMKKLNKQNGGTVSVGNIKLCNFEEYKIMVADLLFP